MSLVVFVCTASRSLLNGRGNGGRGLHSNILIKNINMNIQLHLIGPVSVHSKISISKTENGKQVLLCDRDDPSEHGYQCEFSDISLIDSSISCEKQLNPLGAYMTKESIQPGQMRVLCSLHDDYEGSIESLLSCLKASNQTQFQLSFLLLNSLNDVYDLLHENSSVTCLSASGLSSSVGSLPLTKRTIFGVRDCYCLDIQSQNDVDLVSNLVQNNYQFYHQVVKKLSKEKSEEMMKYLLVISINYYQKEGNAPSSIYILDFHRSFPLTAVPSFSSLFPPGPSSSNGSLSYSETSSSISFQPTKSIFFSILRKLVRSPTSDCQWNIFTQATLHGDNDGNNFLSLLALLRKADQLKGLVTNFSKETELHLLNENYQEMKNLLSQTRAQQYEIEQKIDLLSKKYYQLQMIQDTSLNHLFYQFYAFKEYLAQSITIPPVTSAAVLGIDKNDETTAIMEDDGPAQKKPRTTQSPPPPRSQDQEVVISGSPASLVSIRCSSKSHSSTPTLSPHSPSSSSQPSVSDAEESKDPATSSISSLTFGATVTSIPSTAIPPSTKLPGLPPPLQLPPSAIAHRNSQQEKPPEIISVPANKATQPQLITPQAIRQHNLFRIVPCQCHPPPSSSSSSSSSSLTTKPSTTTESSRSFPLLLTPSHPPVCQWRMNLWKHLPCYICKKLSRNICETCSEYFQVMFSFCDLHFPNHYKIITSFSQFSSTDSSTSSHSLPSQQQQQQRQPERLFQFIRHVNQERKKKGIPSFPFFIIPPGCEQVDGAAGTDEQELWSLLESGAYKLLPPSQNNENPLDSSSTVASESIKNESKKEKKRKLIGITERINRESPFHQKSSADII